MGPTQLRATTLQGRREPSGLYQCSHRNQPHEQGRSRRKPYTQSAVPLPNT